MKKKDKKKKEEIAEDYCFICKDGGHLRVCDFKDCLKAYHPHCVGKDQTFLETDGRWNCGWHSCFICHKGSAFQCYCCPNSLCRGCIRAAEFVPVKRRTKGFCNNCLKLAILIEKNVDVDSDGGKVDFQDTETYEFLFKDYWEIVKDQEGLTLVDLHAADALLKRGENCKNGSDSDKLLEEELMSEADDIGDTFDDGISLFKGLKGKRSKMKLPTKRSRTRKKTFISWGSDALISFLSSIGKNTEEALSQLDVCEVVKDYIQENNLFDPNKKKRKIVVCDERLHSLFRKKKVKLYKIYSLLESHLAANADLDDETSFSSEVGDDAVVSKRQRIVNSDSKVKSELNLYRRKVLEPPKSEYAALVEKNIKSIYVRKSLILKFLKDPETMENKVTGCFVRVKSDTKDFYYSPHKLYQLGQVKGIKKVPQAYKIGEASTDLVLCISNIWKDIRISMLSDDDFEEEECEDLRQLVKKGLFKRPTIVDLDKKIRSVHEDIMNHWIDREIGRLQRLIDRANEKGWRGELFEYIEQRELLRSPDERMRLLKEFPSVIADTEEDIDATTNTPLNLNGKYAAGFEAPVQEVEGNGVTSIEIATEKAAEGTGASSSVLGQLHLGNGAVSCEITTEGEGNCAEGSENVAEDVAGGVKAASTIQRELGAEHGVAGSEDFAEDVAGGSSDKGIKTAAIALRQLDSGITAAASMVQRQLDFGNGEGRETVAEGDSGGINAASTIQRQLDLGDGVVGGENVTEDIAGVIKAASTIQRQLDSGNGAAGSENVAEDVAGGSPCVKSASTVQRQLDVGIKVASTVQRQLDLETEQHNITEANRVKEEFIEIEEDEVDARDRMASEIQIINLDDDDDDDTPNSMRENDSSSADTCAEIVEAATPESLRVWHYIDPAGEEQGPFSIAALRYWMTGGFFDADFKVWRTGQSPKDAILLTDALSLTSS